MRLRPLLTLASVLAFALPAATANADGAASASVNSCSGAFGVRVSAPYRGDGLSSWVRISVEYYSSADGGWHAAPAGDSGWFPAGGPGSSADTGYTFFYAAPSEGHRIVLRGTAQVEWRGRGGTSASVGTGECQVGGDAAQSTAQRIISIGAIIQPKDSPVTESAKGIDDRKGQTSTDTPPPPTEAPATTTTTTEPPPTTTETTATPTTTTAEVVEQVATTTAEATSPPPQAPPTTSTETTPTTSTPTETTEAPKPADKSDAAKG